MRRLLRKAAAFFAADALARLIGFVVVLGAARVLGPAEFGEFAFAYAVVGVALLISDFGLTPLIMRRLARGERDSRVFWSAAIVNLCASAVVYIAAVGALSIAFPARANVLELYGVVLFVQALASSTDAALFAAGRAPRVGQIRLCGNAVLAIGAAICLTTTPSAFSLGGAFVAASLVKLGLSYGSARALVGRPSFSPGLVRRLVMSAAPFAAAALLSFLYFRVDVILLGIWSTARSVGEYGAAYRFVDGLILLPSAIAYTFFPAWMRQEGDADTWKLVRTTAAAGTAAMVALVFAAKPLTAIVLGSAYGEAAQALRILALGVPLLFIDVIAVWIAYAHGKERGVVAVSGAALAANLVLNALLIPALAVKGAAIATVGSEVVNLAGYVVLLRGSLFGGRYAVARTVEHVL